MHLIVGLGNPGPEFAGTRHNVGWMCVERLARRVGVAFDRYQFRAQLARWEAGGTKVLLAKPLTFMNHSGEAVGPLVKFYKVPLERLMVVYDDLDLPPGRIRIRPKGSAGGHHGMESIIQRLGSSDFPRLRIGIGRPAGSGAYDPEVVARYVLSPFSAGEWPLIDAALDRAVEALTVWVGEGIEAAMNRFNV
jgi:PTH1 family peptidyl-tRNA hydrolase